LLQEGTDSILDEGRRARRAPRRDRGSHQVTERDRELLAYVAEQYAVTLDQLAVLIGRSYRTARGLRDRWCNAGWTNSSRLSVDLPPFVWLTSRGTTIAGSLFRTWQPNHGLIRHTEAVTNVRLLLEHQLQLGQWRCERSIAKKARAESRFRDHLADAVLLTPEKTAIEVELTLKSRRRLEQIMLDVGIAYDQVWYFAAPRLLPVLHELAAAAPYSNIVVYRYPPRAADVIGAARMS
jgi:DNA-binding CsgD family transcriptional regulator